jgi:hypothetical protein
MQLAARRDPHERLVLADWYEAHGHEDLAASTRGLHGLYRPDASAMAEVMSGRPDVSRLWRDELPERLHRTRRRVNKMTAAEAARMPEWVDSWIKIGLSTDRADRPMFEAAVAACYRYSGLEMPRAIVWAPCPIVVAYAGPIASAVLRRLGHSSASVRDSVSDGVRDSVGDSVNTSVRSSVRDSVRSSVRDSVSTSVSTGVHASVSTSVDASVSTNVSTNVDASVRNSVDASVSASVRDSVSTSVDVSVDASVVRVRTSLRTSVGTSVGGVNSRVGDGDLAGWHQYQGGQFWVGGWCWWSPAAVSFAIDVLRLDIGEDLELRARAYAATMSSACWWWPHRDFVVVSERPTLIDRHASGELREARWEWVSDDGELCSWGVSGEE